MKYTYVFRGEVASKKNSRVMALVNGRRLLIPSRKYREWEKVAKQVIMASQRPERPLEAATLSMTIYHGDMVKRDSNNATQGVQDVLVEMGVLSDDNWMVIGTPTVQHRIDVTDPRLVVDVVPAPAIDWRSVFKAARKAAKG